MHTARKEGLKKGARAMPEYTPYAFSESHNFLHRLKAFQGKIPAQKLQELRTQALKGDLEGAETMFRKLVRRLQMEE